MPTFTIAYSDGRTTLRKGELPFAVNAPDEAAALEHATLVERERVAKAKAAGVDLVAATPAIVAKVKD